MSMKNYYSKSYKIQLNFQQHQQHSKGLALISSITKENAE